MQRLKTKPAPTGNSQTRNAEASDAQIAPKKTNSRIGSLHARLIRHLPAPPQSDFYDATTGCLYLRTMTTQKHPVTGQPVFVWFRRAVYMIDAPIPSAYLIPSATKAAIIRALPQL